MKVVPNFNHDKIAFISVDIQKVYDVEIMKRDGAAADWGAWKFKEAGRQATKVLNACREKGYTIIHLTLLVDDFTAHPLEERDEKGQLIYSVKGTVGSEIIDSMKPWPGELVIEKNRTSGFYETNLDNVLRNLGIKHLILVGGFSDACFLTTAYDAWSRNYTLSIVKDAVTAGSDGAHKAAILTLANWTWGTSIFLADEMIKAIKGLPYSAWFWERSQAFPYTTSNIDEMYEQLK